MYRQYVDILARRATEIFSRMTGTEVLGHKVKIDERLGEMVPLAHIISYQHLRKPIKGHFILGFTDQSMALAVAVALAEKKSLAPVDELDETAGRLLNEFMKTVVEQTVSDWEQMGWPVKISPPTSLEFTRIKVDNALQTHAYVVIVELNFSYVIFRVTFRADEPAAMGKKKILVVEESTVIRSIIASTLVQYGFNVQQAENGRNAVKLFGAFKPQLVLMDLATPGGNGLEAIENIKKIDNKVRFIVLTASSPQQDVLKNKIPRVQSYLPKPFNPDLLMREVNRIFTTPVEAEEI